MADAGTRIRVGVVGTSKFGRIRVDLGAEETVGRQQLVTKAAAKLEVPLAASDVGRVRLYFSDGDDIDEVSLLEKDDTVFLAFDGGAWREASEDPAVSSSSAGPEPPPPPPPPSQADKPASAPQQRSLGSFFGAGTKRSFERDEFGRKVESSGPPQHLSRDELEAMPASTAGKCQKCGRTFTKAGPMATHVKSCKGLGFGGSSSDAPTAPLPRPPQILPPLPLHPQPLPLPMLPPATPPPHPPPPVR